MRSFIKISMYLFLLVLLTAEDCSNSSTESVSAPSQNDFYQNLQDDIVSEELNESAVLLYEKRGIQKVKDFIDYLNMYADSSLNINFRKQAKLMMTESFLHQSDIQNFYKLLNLIEDNTNSILLKSDRAFEVQVDSIFVESALQLIGSRYVGELEYRLILKNEHLGKSDKSEDYNCRAQIYVVKTSKQFGNEKLDVWEVYLGKPILF